MRVTARHPVGMRKPTVAKLPLLVWLVVAVTMLSCLTGGIRIFSYNITGWAWVVPFTIALLKLARFITKVRFPIWIWLPWILVVVIYLAIYPQDNALQRSLMLLCPIIVGAAVSTLRMDTAVLDAFGHRIVQVAIFFFVMILANMGVFLTGALPETTGLAPQVTTAALLAALFSVRYSQQERRCLVYWGFMALVPVIAVTRTGIVATAVTLPFTLGPMKLKKRVFILGAMILVALALFYTERFQHKMFYSGSGTLEDLRTDNPNFRGSGRFAIWDSLEAEIEKEPWFGHGANAQETYVRRYFGGLAHPHNDWIRLMYDYGYVGTAAFALALILQLVHLWWVGRRTRMRNHYLLLAGALAFLPFTIFMVTDNIILYASFFGNLHFTMLGMVYAAAQCQNQRSGQLLNAGSPVSGTGGPPANVAVLGPLVGWEKLPRS